MFSLDKYCVAALVFRYADDAVNSKPVISFPHSIYFSSWWKSLTYFLLNNYFLHILILIYSHLENWKERNNLKGKNSLHIWMFREQFVLIHLKTLVWGRVGIKPNHLAELMTARTRLAADELQHRQLPTVSSPSWTTCATAANLFPLVKMNKFTAER